MGCFLCFRQVDFKSLVAYSSISHMGMALVGCFSFSRVGVEGSILIFFGHGFCSSCLFFLVNLLYERLFSRSVLLWGLSGYQLYGSLLVFSVFFFFNMALPPFVSFISEYFIFFCCVFFDWSLSFFLVRLIFLSGFYNVYAYLRIYCGCFEGGSGGFGISLGEVLRVFLRGWMFVFLLFLAFYFF